MQKNFLTRYKKVGLALTTAFALLLAFSLLTNRPPPAAARSPHAAPPLAARLAARSGCTITQVTSTTAEINDQPVLNRPDGSRLAFWSTANLDPPQGNPDGNPEIFLYDIRTATFTQVTSTTGNILGGFNFAPALNAAGDRVLFFSDDITPANPTGNFEIFQADIGRATDLLQVTNTTHGFNIDPSLSADGRLIAFSSDEDHTGHNADRNTEIFLADLTNPGHFVQISHSSRGIFGGFNLSPAVSGDGRYVAFASDRDLVSQNGDENSEIFLCSIASQTISQLTRTTDQHNHQVSINADGSRAAFTVDKNGSSEIFLYRSGLTVPVTALGGTSHQPALSEDGTFLAFVSGADIFLANTADTLSRPIQITEAPSGSADQPSLTAGPGGIRITFAATQNLTGHNPDHNREIFLANCEGTDLVLTKTGFPNPVTAGHPLTYTLSITNTGPAEAHTILLTDTLPLGNPGLKQSSVTFSSGCGWSGDLILCELGQMSPGAAGTITITGQTGSKTGLITNTASLSAGTPDYFPSNNRVQQTTVITAGDPADLSISKQCHPTNPATGQILTYTVVITSQGPENPVKYALLSDTVPAGLSGVTWICQAAGASECGLTGGEGLAISTTVETLSLGDPVTYTITGTVSAAAGSILTNTATVIPPEAVPDPSPGNNTTTITNTVIE